MENAVTASYLDSITSALRMREDLYRQSGLHEIAEAFAEAVIAIQQRRRTTRRNACRQRRRVNLPR